MKDNIAEIGGRVSWWKRVQITVSLDQLTQHTWNHQQFLDALFKRRGRPIQPVSSLKQKHITETCNEETPFVHSTYANQTDVWVAFDVPGIPSDNVGIQFVTGIF